MTLFRPVFLCLASFLLLSQLVLSADQPLNGYEPKWWKEAVVYQVYPRSFKDSNGDGIGDLKGITSKLDYIQGLGVNVIWLSPHYDSPNADNGYDIRDYRKVMTEFGTMADFDELLKGVKQRHMRLDPRPGRQPHQRRARWFVESRKSKDNPYRDYYIWRPAKDGERAQQLDVLLLRLGVEARSRDRRILPAPVRREAARPQLGQSQGPQRSLRPDEVLARQGRRRLSHGRDPVHLQAARTCPTSAASTSTVRSTSTRMGPHLHEYLQEMNREVLSKYDVMTVGEAFGVTLEQTPVAGRRAPPRTEHDLQLRRGAPRSAKAEHGSTGRCPNSRPSTPARTRRSTSIAGTPSSSPTTTIRASSRTLAMTRRSYRVASAKAAGHHAAHAEGHALHLPGRRARHDQLSLHTASKSSTTSR